MNNIELLEMIQSNEKMFFEMYDRLSFISGLSFMFAIIAGIVIFCLAHVIDSVRARVKILEEILKEKSNDKPVKSNADLRDGTVQS